MNCQRAAELMSDYLDNALEQAVCKSFEAHLESCERCREELRAMNAMLVTAKSLAEEKAPVDCWPGVRTRITAVSETRRAWLRWLPHTVAAPIAAAALIAALLLGRPALIDDPAPQAPAVEVEVESYISAHAELQRRQVLSDPDVAFIAAELDKASFGGSVQGL